MTVFLVKMSLIVLAGANLLIFDRLAHRPDWGGSLVSAAVASLVLWTAVLICGRFIGFL